MRSVFYTSALGLCIALVAGCGRNDVQVYRVSKEDSKPVAQDQSGAMPAGHPDMGESAPRIKYTLPPSWQEAPRGQMRVASFRVTGKDSKQADVGVVADAWLDGKRFG